MADVLQTRLLIGLSTDRPLAGPLNGGYCYLARDVEGLSYSDGTQWFPIVEGDPAVTVVTANYAILETDRLVVVNAASTTVTLPPAAGLRRRFIIKNGASGATTTVATTDTFDDSSKATLTAAGAHVEAIAFGGVWYLI